MIKKFIHKIKSKPQRVRTLFALTVSLSVTALIISFWIVSYIQRSNEILNTKTDHNPSDFIDKISQEVGSSYDDAKDRFDFSRIFDNSLATTSSDGTNTEDMSAASSDNSNYTGPFDASSASVSGAMDTANNAPADSVPVPASTARASDSASFDDILNTKKQDNQGANATTSSEVLVQ